MNIDNLGKGALPDPPDERDFKAAEIMGAVNVDWSKEFRVPEPPNQDQDSSDSCVAHAWSYYKWQLHRKDYSRRDLFCRIALPDFGAYIRDGGKETVKNGQSTKDEVSDPGFQTPQNMRDKSGTKQEFREDDKELNYFVLPQQDINGVAWGIQNYKGVVFGLTGSNPGWADLKNPRPPRFGETTWGHALYAMGFHMHDGQKCIIAKSSWCKTGVTEHHIKEIYFTTGNTFSAWTLIPNNTMQLVNDKGTVYIVTGNKDKRKIGIADEEALGIFGDEPQIPMDTSSIPEYQTISKGFVINNK